MLPVEWLEGKEEEHIMTISTKRSDFMYCSYLRLLHKAAEDTTEPPMVASAKQMCSKCTVYLCNEHFATYHFCGTNNNEDDEMDDSAIQLCTNVLTLLTYIICRIMTMG